MSTNHRLALNYSRQARETLASILTVCNESFHSTNISGSPRIPTGSLPYLGQLDYITATIGLLGISDYIIRSYQTPIAWRVNGQWVMPNVTYSVSITKHQGIIRVALARIDAVIVKWTDYPVFMEG